MARYSIKEMYDAYREHTESVLGINYCFLGSSNWKYNPDPEPEPEPDTRKDYVKLYADTENADLYVVDKYGEYVYIKDCATPLSAWLSFSTNNVVYALLHDAELTMLYKAHTSDFNPIENYDRYEDSTVDVLGASGMTTQVAPDDSELFTNVGNATNNTSATNTTTSHIHGNIGVTTATQMLKEVYNLYRGSSWIDELISTLINDSCMIVDYGYNAL